jgi:hypothetical protein
MKLLSVNRTLQIVSLAVISLGVYKTVGYVGCTDSPLGHVPGGTAEIFHRCTSFASETECTFDSAEEFCGDGRVLGPQVPFTLECTCHMQSTLWQDFWGSADHAGVTDRQGCTWYVHNGPFPKCKSGPKSASKSRHSFHAEDELWRRKGLLLIPQVVMVFLTAWAMAASRQLVLTRLHEVGFLHFNPPEMLGDISSDNVTNMSELWRGLSATTTEGSDSFLAANQLAYVSALSQGGIPPRLSASIKNIDRWEAAQDSAGRTYYYHIRTGKTQWEKPSSLLTEDDLPEGWSEHTAPDGRKYYHQASTNTTRWTSPKFGPGGESDMLSAVSGSFLSALELPNMEVPNIEVFVSKAEVPHIEVQ